MERKLSAKQKILQNIFPQTDLPLPPFAQKIYEGSRNQVFSMNQKFKNLQNPLNFIHNDHIQNLVDITQRTRQKLRKQMQETTQFSKNMYKKIISRQGNQFSFQNLMQNNQKLRLNQNDDLTILKAQKNLRCRQPNEAFKQLQKKRKFNQQNAEKIKKLRAPKQYRHQFQQARSAGSEVSKVDLSYQHIKLIDTNQFQVKCKHVELYDILKSERKQYHRVYNQQFDIYLNQPIDRLMSKMLFQPIDDDCYFNDTSKELFYDFSKNLKFWRQNSKNSNLNQNQPEKKQKKTDEEVLSQFHEFSKKQISINNIYDFAMRKITCETLRQYFTLKKQHKTKFKMGQNNQNLDDMYYQLKKQYQYAHQMKMKTKAQRIPAKYVDTQCQTIRLLEQKQFDSYFSQDVKQILVKLAKLNKLRQKSMAMKNDKKFVLIKNICIDTKQMLFKLLIIILKGQKFYPREEKNKKNFIPFFTYSQLFQAQNREEVERKILQLIYTKIHQFQCDKIEGVQKSQLIKVYIQERETNSKVLQIIQAQ